MKDILILIAELAIALIIGAAVGCLGFIFNKIENESTRLLSKSLWAVMCAVAFVIISEEVGLPDAKYVASLFFGYASYRVWGKDKPNKQLANLWLLI